MTNFFFDDDEADCFFEDIAAVDITWVDASGSLQGTAGNPVKALFDQEGRVDRDDQGGNLVVGPKVLTLKTVDLRKILNSSVLIIDGVRYIPLRNAAFQIDDGQLSILPIEKE